MGKDALCLDSKGAMVLNLFGKLPHAIDVDGANTSLTSARIA